MSWHFWVTVAYYSTKCGFLVSEFFWTKSLSPIHILGVYRKFNLYLIEVVDWISLSILGMTIIANSLFIAFLLFVLCFSVLSYISRFHYAHGITKNNVLHQQKAPVFEMYPNFTQNYAIPWHTTNTDDFDHKTPKEGTIIAVHFSSLSVC